MLYEIPQDYNTKDLVHLKSILKPFYLQLPIKGIIIP